MTVLPDTAADLYAAARINMVDSQVRPNKVTDGRIIAAMRTLPREEFVPETARHLAYIDEDVALPGGRVLMEPMVIARLIQLAAPVAGERALVVASGTGYGAAILAACGLRVTALEQDKDLAAIAETTLTQYAPGVTLVSGPLDAGWVPGSPYDVILIEGAVPAIPQALGGQLRRDGGRLVGVVNQRNRKGFAVLAEVSEAGLSQRAAFDCNTPTIPSLIPAPAFSF